MFSWVQLTGTVVETSDSILTNLCSVGKDINLKPNKHVAAKLERNAKC